MDAVSFAGGAAVTVGLAAGTATGQGSDTLSNIENVIGSSDADDITGSAGANSLSGGAGPDTLPPFSSVANPRARGGSHAPVLPKEQPHLVPRPPVGMGAGEAKAQDYRVHSLPTLPSFSNALAHRINASEQIVGQSFSSGVSVALFWFLDREGFRSQAHRTCTLKREHNDYSQP
jgi:hypothetical protein